jgi:hypothetical protein
MASRIRRKPCYKKVGVCVRRRVISWCSLSMAPKKGQKRRKKKKAPIAAFFALGEPSSAGADGNLFIEIEVVVVVTPLQLQFQFLFFSRSSWTHELEACR